VIQPPDKTRVATRDTRRHRQHVVGQRQTLSRLTDKPSRRYACENVVGQRQTLKPPDKPSLRLRPLQNVVGHLENPQPP